MFWSIQKSKYEWYGPADHTEPRACFCTRLCRSWLHPWLRSRHTCSALTTLVGLAATCIPPAKLKTCPTWPFTEVCRSRQRTFSGGEQFCGHVIEYPHSQETVLKVIFKGFRRKNCVWGNVERESPNSRKLTSAATLWLYRIHCTILSTVLLMWKSSKCWGGKDTK